MKRNLVGKILGKIKIFVQDFVPIRTALRAGKPQKRKEEVEPIAVSTRKLSHQQNVLYRSTNTGKKINLKKKLSPQINILHLMITITVYCTTVVSHV